MNTRLDNPLTEADPLLRGVLITSVAIVAIGVLLLVRATVGGRVDHVTVRVSNSSAPMPSIVPAAAYCTRKPGRQSMRPPKCFW